MRIGITTSVIQRGQTGIARYVFGLLRAFLACADQHEIIVFALEEDLPLFDFARGRFQLSPVAEHFRPPLHDLLWHQTILPGLTRRHQLQLLHVPSYRRLPWARNCALVGTVHDLAAFHVAEKYDWKRMFFGRVVARQLAARQHQIIAVSRNTAADLHSFWRLPSTRVTVIHQGLDHDRFTAVNRQQKGADTRQRRELRKPFFLYTARLEHPGKNHVRLIKAFEWFKAESGSNWQLVLAGSDWHGAEAIHTAIKQSPARQDIRCLGFVPESELPGLYQAADVFVYPSLYEGFGFPPLEAMACGCPVVCSDRGALAETVGDAAAMLNPEDELKMKELLCVLQAEPDRRQRLAAAGLERVRLFNWKRTALETLRVYERACASAGVG